jgi:hypothetical protein
LYYSMNIDECGIKRSVFVKIETLKIFCTGNNCLLMRAKELGVCNVQRQQKPSSIKQVYYTS